MHVVGARPNFVKTAPLMAEMERYPEQFSQVLAHTGQHYDYNMSMAFFQDLAMPAPDEFLNVGSGTHAEQTARIMLAFEPVVVKYKPDWVMVVGDVNSTLACALVCAKLGVRVAHVEAGLRSGDRTMPEEINRLLTDQISDLLFTPSLDANENLRREGVAPEKIHFVGNVMIDTLVRMLPLTAHCTILEELRLRPHQYVLVTLHRPSNVDEPETLRELLRALEKIALDMPVLFPVHPRTTRKLAEMGMERSSSNLCVLEPQGYLNFLTLMKNARIVITDSGGIQEETSFLGIPCLTVRENTERPITITQGTNQLVSANAIAIVDAFQKIAQVQRTGAPRIPLWDGRASKRIVELLSALSPNV